MNQNGEHLRYIKTNGKYSDSEWKKKDVTKVVPMWTNAHCTNLQIEIWLFKHIE